jgi:hypothetical protein
MSDTEDPDARDPAQARVGQLLVSLRDQPVPTGRALVRTVLRRVRIQRAIAAPLRALGHLAGAVADGLRMLLNGRKSR